MIRAVARLGPVTVLAYGDPDDQVSAAFLKAAGPGVRLRTVRRGARYTPWRLVRGLLGTLPIHVLAERSRAFEDAVREELDGSDTGLVLCELVAMYDALRTVRRAPPVIIDTHNIDSLVLARYQQNMRSPLRRLYAGVTSRKLARFEQVAFAAAEAVVVCSEVEADVLRASVPADRIWVVPNGADLQRFQPRGMPEIPQRLLFFGRLDYYPNRDAIEFFIQDILPRIRERHPGAEFHVAGAGDDRPVRELAQAVPGVVLHGRVEDLAALVESAAIVVVPLRCGGGTRLKILEALAAGRPVVSTTVGAEGLDMKPGSDLLFADGADAFSQAVIGLLADPAKARALGDAGRRAVQSRYDWQAIESGAADRIAALRLVSAGRS